MNKRGKIIFAVLIFFVIISFSSYFVLAVDSIYTKSYNSATSTAIIKNGITDIAKIKLETPHVYNVIRGKDRLVAEFTINNYADISNVFNNLDFYDLKENNKKIERQFIYKYRQVAGQKAIPSYKQECSKTGKGNETICNQILEGTRYEDIIKWDNLDTTKTLPKGNITIGIFTDVYPNENIEWVPTLYGMKINEWASWNDSYTNGLLAVYTMDTGSGTALKNDFTGNATEGILSTGMQWTVNGKNNNATLYNGVSDYIDIQNKTLGNVIQNNSDWTISLWVNLTNNGEDYLLADNVGGLVNPSWMYGISGQELQFYYLTNYPDDWFEVRTIGVAIPASNIWQHLILLHNSSGMFFYVNGTQVTTLPATYGNPSSSYNWNTDISIGARIDAPYNLLGGVDEVTIWNRILTSSEISDLYNNGEGVFYSSSIIPHLNQLTITPQNPTTDDDLYCNATLIDDQQTNLTAYWETYLNGDLYLSGETQAENGTETFFTEILNEDTVNGDNVTCMVTPFDGTNYGIKRSVSVLIPWQITFNVTDSYNNVSLDDVSFSCNQAGFNQLNDTTNPYGTYNFTQGNYQCGFEKENYYNKTIIFTADSNKIVDVPISAKAQITSEEHMWLEWLYNCWRYGECKALLENINQTATQIWNKLIETNRAVVTQEDILSNSLSSEQNISINYTISIPYKEDVAVNELLPMRVYFWFTDENKTRCYSQDKTTDTNRAEAPYCLPLVAEVLGPNNGSINFQVDLRPALANGTYEIVRSIEVDPKGVWTQYGREEIGQIKVLEGTNKAEISLTEKAKIFAEKSRITGAIIGAVQTLLSGWQIVIITAVAGLVIIIFIISRTKVKLKR